MPGFFYFIPDGRPGIGLAELDRLGLGYAFESRSIAVRQVPGGGPGGHGGALLAAADRGGDERLGYFADQQTWQKIVESEAHPLTPSPPHPLTPSVGFYTAEPPGPELLVRNAPLEGWPLTLADGRPWVIPRARAFFEEDGELQWRYGLPHVSRLGEDGRWSTGKVAPRYADLWGIAERWETERLTGGDEDAEESAESQEERYQRLHDTAAAVLRANYRVGRVEVSLLGLLSTAHVLQVLDELIDLPTRLDWLEKKTGPTATGTGPGSAD